VCVFGIIIIMCALSLRLAKLLSYTGNIWCTISSSTYIAIVQCSLCATAHLLVDFDVAYKHSDLFILCVLYWLNYLVWVFEIVSVNDDHIL